MNGYKEHKIGEFQLKDQPVVINRGRRTCVIQVKNEGVRTIQIGSHFHFFEVNRALAFDREKAFGMHLDIPSGTAIRFAPGQTHEVQLTEYAGEQIILGFNDLTNGCVRDADVRERALEKARQAGFIKEEQG